MLCGCRAGNVAWLCRQQLQMRGKQAEELLPVEVLGKVRFAMCVSHAQRKDAMWLVLVLVFFTATGCGL